MLNSFDRKISLVLAASIFVLLALLIVLASVPPVSRDALTHHLAVPKLWIQHGGFYETPSIEFSYFPMNVDLLYIIPLLFENDIIPKYIHFSFGVLTACLIVIYLRRFTNIKYALCGGLFFLSTPVIVKLSTSVYVDLGLAFFSFSALLILFCWANRGFQHRHLLASAIACGLALGTKYNGMISFVLLTVMVPGIYLKSNPMAINKQAKAILYTVFYISVSLLIFSPWMLKNYQLTGNPVYPLYESVISDQTENASPKLGPWIQRKLVYKENFLEIVSIPVRIFFQGKDDNPKYFDGKLNPLFLILSPFSILCIKRKHKYRNEIVALIFYSLFFLLYAYFSTDMRIRYLLPMIPPLSVLSIIGFAEINASLNKINAKYIKMSLNALILTIFLSGLLMNATYIYNLYKNIDPFPYITGKVSRDQYIEKNRPEFGVIRYVNVNLDENTKILCLFVGNRRYYFDRDVEFGNDNFRRTVKDAASNEDILKDLKQLGYTHMVVGMDIFLKWKSILFSQEESRTVDNFFIENIEPIFTKNGYALFRLR